jgi:formylglycine-generating enzyme required for sulfatase activity
MKKILLATAILAGASLTAAHADNFGTGANQFTLDFTTIGNPGNAADTTGYGSVGYEYRIGTHEISQYQIDRATASGLANVVAGAFSGDRPAGNMSWYESAAFVNWLNTSKSFAPAYNLTWSGSTWSMALWTEGTAGSGYDTNNLYRNSLAKYFLPSENEFYKAAFGKSDGNGYYLYPTASSNAPTPVTSGTNPGTAVYNQTWGQGPASIYQAGGRSSYGTMGQGGNMQEWQESAEDGTNNNVGDQRLVRGGYWYGISSDPIDSSNKSRSSFPPSTDNYSNLGFRVASVSGIVPEPPLIPEPSTYALFGLGVLAMVIAYRRKMA